MAISVEPQIFTIRGGSSHFKFGDPYDFVITAVKSGEHSVRLIAMVRRDDAKPFCITDFKMIRAYLKSIGIISAEWERINRDHVYHHGAVIK